MTKDELQTIPDATLVAIARNNKHYEASEDRDNLIQELADRVELASKTLNGLLTLPPEHLLIWQVTQLAVNTGLITEDKLREMIKTANEAAAMEAGNSYENTLLKH